MKTNFAVLLLVGLASASSEACTMTREYFVGLKNNLVTIAANKVGADVTDSKIKLSGYDGKFIYKYVKPTGECHDGVITIGEVALTYKNPYNEKQTCSARVEVYSSKLPRYKGDEEGKLTKKARIVSLSENCRN